jgi:cell pole-organizing protein PopZ
MSDAKGAGNDPSMDDILASIRKIISDDEARAQVSADPASVSGARNDDVLLLTDLVEEPPEPPPAPPTPLSPRTDPVDAGEMPQPAVPSFPPAAPVASVTPVEAPMKQPSDGLVESGAASVASSAFERLSQAVQDNVPTPAAQDAGPAVGSRNLEDIVKEMLRPMLKEWLDKNLPPLVERYVEREIVRLTRR